MRKPQLLILLIIISTGAFLHGADTRITENISVNEKGIISTNGIKFGLVHFSPEWKYANQHNNLNAIKSSKQNSCLQFDGIFNAVSGDFNFQETVISNTPDSVDVSYLLKSKIGVPTNSLILSLPLPIDSFAGTNLIVDGNAVKLPVDFKSQNVPASSSFQKIIIPTQKGKIEITGENIGLYIQDNRQYKGNTFDVRFNFKGVEKVTAEAGLKLKISAPDYQADTLDISKVANMGFADETDGDKIGGWSDQGSKNDLSAIKTGKQKFGTVTLDIIDPAKNNGKSSLIFAGPGRPYFLKEASVPASGKSYKNLYLLHASAWTPQKGEKTGEIIAQYTDGSESVIPIVSRVDCGEWWGASSIKNGAVVWTTENKSAYIGLFLSKFKLSEKPLKSIKLKGSGKAVWMIAGIGASSEDIPLPEESPCYIVAGKDWAPFHHSLDIKSGSIFDFSSMVDAPAGKYGHVTTTPEGHFSFAKAPGKRLKLSGGNLCFSANFLAKADADLLAKRFQMMGWNTVRFHHYDRDLVGGWNSMLSYTVDPKQLDRLDYMFAAMKKAGMYITIDLYTIREFGPEEIPEIKGPAGRSIKGLVPVLPSAYKAWTVMVEKLMNHVNPYTGLAWKDDPAFYSLCPLNEDTITTAWKSTPELKEIYLKKYSEWLADKGLKDEKGEKHDAQFQEFLIETKLRSNRQIEAFFRKLGVKALITGSNFISSLPQTFMRSEFDFVDNHTYWDHPSFPEKNWSLPFGFAKGSVLKSFSEVPREMMPSRIFGKPFTVTEYNYCPPNRFRAEGGPVIGAYAALQDWDGLYRFAWSHNSNNTISVKPIGGFDISTDPLNILGEKLISLLFARGDIAPSRNSVIYAVTMKEACGKSSGWAGPGFPDEFSKIGLVTRIGSQAIYDKHPKIDGKFSCAVSKSAPDSQVLNGVKWISPQDAYAKYVTDPVKINSDTGQIKLATDEGTLRIVSPLTECLVMPKGKDLNGNVLKITENDTFTTVSVSSMDGKELAKSKRVLLLHLTDVSNTKMLFRNASMRLLDKWGELPHLVRKSSVEVKLQNSNPGLKLWAVDMSGKRLDEVPVKYENGCYLFKTETAPNKKESRMAYELAGN